MVKKMGLVFKNGKMVVNIKEILYKMKQLDGVYFIMLMVIYIKENFQKILQMDMVNIYMKMVQFIMEIG
jgi:hypothetical protein